MKSNSCGWEVPCIFTAFVILKYIVSVLGVRNHIYTWLEKALNYGSYAYAVHVCVLG